MTQQTIVRIMAETVARKRVTRRTHIPLIKMAIPSIELLIPACLLSAATDGSLFR